MAKENQGLETYFDRNNKKMALVIRNTYQSEGIVFLTNDEDEQQVAYMSHKSGHLIKPHFHNRIERSVFYTCETIVLKKGELVVNLYDDCVILHTFSLFAGDILTLFSGGHGFVANGDIEMVEIKQGPFLGEKDKTRF